MFRENYQSIDEPKNSTVNQTSGDIVDLLRRSMVPLEWTSLGEEAADEIERLRQRIIDLELEKNMWERQVYK